MSSPLPRLLTYLLGGTSLILVICLISCSIFNFEYVGSDSYRANQGGSPHDVYVLAIGSAVFALLSACILLLALSINCFAFDLKLLEIWVWGIGLLSFVFVLICQSALIDHTKYGGVPIARDYFLNSSTELAVFAAFFQRVDLSFDQELVPARFDPADLSYYAQPVFSDRDGALQYVASCHIDWALLADQPADPCALDLTRVVRTRCIGRWTPTKFKEYWCAQATLQKEDAEFERAHAGDWLSVEERYAARLRRKVNAESMAALHQNNVVLVAIECAAFAVLIAAVAIDLIVRKVPAKRPKPARRRVRDPELGIAKRPPVPQHKKKESVAPKIASKKRDVKKVKEPLLAGAKAQERDARIAIAEVTSDDDSDDKEEEEERSDEEEEGEGRRLPPVAMKVLMKESDTTSGSERGSKGQSTLRSVDDDATGRAGSASSASGAEGKAVAQSDSDESGPTKGTYSSGTGSERLAPSPRASQSRSGSSASGAKRGGSSASSASGAKDRGSSASSRQSASGSAKGRSSASSRKSASGSTRGSSAASSVKSGRSATPSQTKSSGSDSEQFDAHAFQPKKAHAFQPKRAPPKQIPLLSESSSSDSAPFPPAKGALDSGSGSGSEDLGIRPSLSESSGSESEPFAPYPPKKGSASASSGSRGNARAPQRGSTSSGSGSESFGAFAPKKGSASSGSRKVSAPPSQNDLSDSDSEDWGSDTAPPKLSSGSSGSDSEHFLAGPKAVQQLSSSSDSPPIEPPPKKASKPRRKVTTSYTSSSTETFSKLEVTRSRQSRSSSDSERTESTSTPGQGQSGPIAAPPVRPGHEDSSDSSDSSRLTFG